MFVVYCIVIHSDCILACT